MVLGLQRRGRALHPRQLGANGGEARQQALVVHGRRQQTGPLQPRNGTRALPGPAAMAGAALAKKNEQDQHNCRKQTRTSEAVVAS